MGNFKDLTGVVFGFSKVIDLAEKGGSGKHAKWNCVCKCGQPHIKSSSAINAVLKKRTGYVGSCGNQCKMMLAARDTTPKQGYISRMKDLTGVVFGFSKVVNLAEKGGSGKHAKWNCICKCSQPHIKSSVAINDVLKGKEGCYGSCSPKCAHDFLKRQEIESNLVYLKILAKKLEKKWNIKIGIGTLRQAKENNWDFYFTGDKCRNGHVDAKATNRRQCLQCRSDESSSNKAKERGKRWRSENKEHMQEQWKVYYQENAEKIRKRSSDWQKDNPERVKQQREQVRSTPEGRLLHNLRNRLNKIMKRIDVVKDSTTLDLLGCDAVKAKEHIQSQFTEGMSWENYGDWDVDHIKPCAAFDLIDPEEQKKAFNYKNLQPLWSTPASALKHSIVIPYEKTNISKGSLFEGERHYFDR